MEKGELIELVEDQLGELRTNQARRHFHPEIIAYTFDKHYRLMIEQAYGQDPFSIEGCVDTSYDVPVYADNNTQLLFSIIPKQTINLHPVQGGIFDAWKSTDSTVKFEPYSRHFERRKWNRLSANFYNSVRYWVEVGTAGDDVSASSADNSTFSDYQSTVWFKAQSAQLTNSDTVDLDLIPTFYAHGDSQEVFVPKNVGGINYMIEMARNDILRKLGFAVDQERDEENRQE